MAGGGLWKTCLYKESISAKKNISGPFLNPHSTLTKIWGQYLFFFLFLIKSYEVFDRALQVKELSEKLSVRVNAF